MCSFVALRAKVNQSLSTAFSDASIPPLLFLLFFIFFFFWFPANRLDPREWGRAMRDVLCFVGCFFSSAQRIGLDSHVGRARCGLFCVFGDFSRSSADRFRFQCLEVVDASCVVLMLSESNSIPKVGRARCERLWMMCRFGSMPSGSNSTPEVGGERCVLWGVSFGPSGSISIPGVGMRTMRDVVGFFSEVIMMIGQLPRVMIRPGSGQVMPKLRFCVITSIVFNVVMWANILGSSGVWSTDKYISSGKTTSVCSLLDVYVFSFGRSVGSLRWWREGIEPSPCGLRSCPPRDPRRRTPSSTRCSTSGPTRWKQPSCHR